MRRWLRDIRIKNGMTQFDVAEKSKISRSYYTHIERGEKTPKVEVAKKIARALGFDWQIFFEDECSFKEQKGEVG